MEPVCNMRHRGVLAAIIAVFVLLAVVYSLSTRLKYGPDEPAHFIYIRSLATELAFPEIAHHETHTEESSATHEGHQPPLYYALFAVPFALLKAIGVSDDGIWRVLRLMNIPVGACWVYCVYLLASEFFGNEKRALAATAFTAFIPTAAYMAGVINNEILIALLFTLAMVFILRYFKSGKMSAKAAVTLGVIMGLATLTKGQGLLLVPLLLSAAFLVYRRNSYSDLKNPLKVTAAALAAAVLVSGWWFVRAWVVHGSPMPHSLHSPALPMGLLTFVAYPTQSAMYTLMETIWLFGYFWAPYWLLSPFLSWGPYFYSVLGLTAISCLGLGIRIRRDKYLDKSSLSLMIFTVLIVYLAIMRYMFLVDQHLRQQGRLFLVISAVVGIMAVAGYDMLLKSAKAKKAGFIMGLAALLSANIAVIVCAITLYSR